MINRQFFFSLKILDTIIQTYENKPLNKKALLSLSDNNAFYYITA